MVDAEVGLTEEEERSEFYSLMPGQWEKDEDFVLKVEARRKLVVPGDPTSNLVYIFAPRLSIAFRMRLEQARSGKALHTGGALRWEDVLKVAKDVKYAAKLVTDEDMRKVAGPPPSSLAPTTTTRAATSSQP